MTRDQGRRIDRIAELAEARTRRLAADENVHRVARERAETQLAQLQRYREEYAARFQTTGAAWQGRAMEDYRRFLDRLDRAIREQDALVRRATAAQAESAASVRESWRAARAMGRLAEKVDSERRLLDGRREQAATDELGARGPRAASLPTD